MELLWRSGFWVEVCFIRADWIAVFRIARRRDFLVAMCMRYECQEMVPLGNTVCRRNADGSRFVVRKTTFLRAETSNDVVTTLSAIGLCQEWHNYIGPRERRRVSCVDASLIVSCMVYIRTKLEVQATFLSFYFDSGWHFERISDFITRNSLPWKKSAVCCVEVFASVRLVIRQLWWNWNKQL